jgi:UDP-glucose 4-epimerase
VTCHKAENMKCVVIGGGGFIGSHLCEALLAEGHEVTVFDRGEAPNLDRLKQKRASASIGNFFNPEDLRRALEHQDAVFHLLSTTVPQTSNEDPAYDVETNVIGTLRFLDEVRKASIKKVVFASSGGTVYGIPQEIPIKENHPTDPTSSYGIGKLIIEKYLHIYWILYGLDYCVLRIANAYGERQRPMATQGVIPVFLDRALRNEEVVVWGDGSVMRDYIFVTDIANALTKALSYSGELKIFNIGSGQAHSLSDVIHAIERVTGRPLKVKYTSGRSFDVPISVLDISRAQNYLNWTPTISLFEGIARMYAWMLKEYQGS